MDATLTLRGQLCWYQKPGIGLDAINDSLLLEFYCRDQSYYLNLIELFLQSSYQMEIGQTLDFITASRSKSIVKYKTAFPSFYLPIAAAMYMAGIDGEKEHANAKKILMQMGEFFQIQDDDLDLFGDPSCSWLVVQCLQRATPEQCQILQDNYGQKDTKKVVQVRALDEEMNLPAVFSNLIEQYAAPLPPTIFLGLANKIYKRKK
ncbi:FDPS-containing [Ictidomys tridecemlineatus]|uniref:(2E,6E)-farnesyl diphosphate synthase n=1 Tax=Ictidomys tridecemlineatus TaxID=43179 RepID=I3N5A9_ICTTR|nr:FDPS-containing [Ictidomys tridecemlineatus]